MADREIRYCTTEDGARIAYCVEGEGPVLVMCPLFIESFSLEHLLPEQGEFARVLGLNNSIVKFDWRGTGLSEREVSDKSFLADQILDLQAVVTATGEPNVWIWANGNSGPPRTPVRQAIPGPRIESCACRHVREPPGRCASRHYSRVRQLGANQLAPAGTAFR